MNQRKPMETAIEILRFQLTLRENLLKRWKGSKEKGSYISMLKLEIEDIKRALSQLEE